MNPNNLSQYDCHFMTNSGSCFEVEQCLYGSIDQGLILLMGFIFGISFMITMYYIFIQSKGRDKNDK